ncbi:MAG: hypothetical protein JSS95_12475 [Acidobacteria bacterium]|nr:hypothetical protein [Acidobacteriota bacterium]
MESIALYPRLIFALAFITLWLAAWVGAKLGARWHNVTEDLRTDYGVVLGASLTLLGLIIGFTFSMAIGRYDQRKNYEEAEANAIGTEYVRADLLPAAEAATVRNLLKQYTGLRIRFYTTRDLDELRQIDVDTARLQRELWAAASQPAAAQPSPLIALAVGGMNDVLNSQGYTQAAWWNRIPGSAWGLMFLIAIFCNGMLGYGARRVAPRLFVVLPLVIATAFFLIADIDSPRRGIIKVHPQNLESLQIGLK